MESPKILSALLILVVVTLASGQNITTTTSERPPDPTPSPEFDCPDREDRYFPHPTDCTQYYYCTNGLAWLLKCADPLYFNPKTNLCDWDFNVECPPQVTPDPQTKGAIIIGPAPDYECDPEVNGAFPHETDCDLFYDCWKGNASLGQCTETMLFDLKWSGCNWPELTDCGNRTRPTGLPSPTTTTSTTRRPGVTGDPGEFECPSPNGLFADPADCSAYYQCSGGFPYHQVCSGNLLFREDLTVCDYPQNVDCGTRPIPTEKE
jgi:hypothetical protein